MPAATKEETLWVRTEFAFASADRCNCYKHRTKNGNRKRCTDRMSVIMLAHPDYPERRKKLFCLDCWASCRTEKTQPNYQQLKEVAQAREQGLGLVSIRC